MSEQGVAVHLAFDWMIVTYFFLGGLSAGAYLFSVVANYVKQEFKHLAERSAILSLISLSIGLLVLLFDLGQPLRAWRLFIAFNVRSPVIWGVWCLNTFMLISFIYTVLILLNKDKEAKKFACLGVPFAVLTASYTAMLLAHAPGMLLWHTTLLPIMFLNGSIISGIALVMLFSANSQNAAHLSKVGRFVSWLIIIELAMVLGEVVILANGSVESVAMVKTLFSGQLGFLFLGVEILLGAVLPVLILLRAKTTASLQAVASVLILIGIFAMRYVIVVGGQLTS